MAARDTSRAVPRRRADILLVERGLFESRARAQAAIEAGLVSANQKQVLKASETVPADAVLKAEPAHPYVSRGGVKLAGALEQYPIAIEDHVCLDVGASTGGFTPKYCSRTAPAWFSLSTSGAPNCTRRCATIRRSDPWRKPTSARSRASACPRGPISS
jgi:23S rRNA (cytidine1920-2'-O)/16S rRNA (cytidine1409-2'-O)-methyltransferase